MREYLTGDMVYGDDVRVSDDYIDEKWWFIEGYPNYRISDMGRVWSYHSNWFLKPQRDSSGHMQVRLSNDHGNRLFLVHRLMGEAFISNPNNYPEVRHINDVPDDNCLENLEWGTHADNMRDASENDSYAQYQTPIFLTNKKTGEEFKFKSQHEAARKLGLNQGNIAHVLSGRQHTVGGYYVEYADKGDDRY